MSVLQQAASCGCCEKLRQLSSCFACPQLWDLHTGASLTILGKPVTLMKADLMTAAWFEYHAKRLRRLKQDLQVSWVLPATSRIITLYFSTGSARR